MSSEAPVIDADVVEEPQHGQQVVVHHHDTQVELFPGSSPAEVIEQATAVADALKPILQKQGMTTKIGNKDHVQVEGWQTLGALLKVTPVCVSTRRLGPIKPFTVHGKSKGKTWSFEVEGYSWEATVEARTLDGRVIGSATALCSREEDAWKSRDDYALLSMAQTRASSKALASVLRFVVTLAGYSGTPAEEMPGGQQQEEQTAPQGIGQTAALELLAVCKAAGIDGKLTADYLRDTFGQPSPLTVAVSTLTPQQAQRMRADAKKYEAENRQPEPDAEPTPEPEAPDA